MDYWRPKNYPDPPRRYSAGDNLAAVLLVVAFILTLIVLALVEAGRFATDLAKGANHG